MGTHGSWFMVGVIANLYYARNVSARTLDTCDFCVRVFLLVWPAYYDLSSVFNCSCNASLRTAAASAAEQSQGCAT